MKSSTFFSRYVPAGSVSRVPANRCRVPWALHRFAVGLPMLLLLLLFSLPAGADALRRLPEDSVAEVRLARFWGDSPASLAALTANRRELYTALRDYSLLLDSVPSESARKALVSLLSDAEKATLAAPSSRCLQRLLDAGRHFFFDPDSPYRNEEYYLPFAEIQAASSLSARGERTAARALVPLLSLNRPGSVASDIAYARSDGRPGSLHELQAEYILLLFTREECRECRAVVQKLQSDKALNSLLARGKLVVLNIMAGPFSTLRKSSVPFDAASWICGYDVRGILQGQTAYWLRATPSLYLLDSRKRVLCKDAPPERILGYLGRLASASGKRVESGPAFQDMHR